MRILRPILRSVLLLSLALLVLAAPAVATEPSPIDKLTPEERKVLETRVPGWENLTEEQQTRIAKNVLWLRKLSPEQREKLTQRLGTLEEHRERHGRIPEGLRHWRKRPPDKRDEFRRRGLIVHAVGLTMWADLPKAKRALVKEHLGQHGRGRVEQAYFHRLWTLHAKRIAEGELPTTQLSEHAPPHMKKLVEGLREKAQAGDEKAKHRLAHFTLALRTREIGSRLDRVKASDKAAFEKALRTVGSLIRDEAPDLYRQALAGLEKAVESKATLEKYVRRGPFRHRLQDPRVERLRKALDDAWPLLEKDRRLLEAATRLRELLKRAGKGMGRGRSGAGKPGSGMRGPGGRGAGARGPGSGDRRERGPRRGPGPGSQPRGPHEPGGSQPPPPPPPEEPESPDSPPLPPQDAPIPR